MSAFEKLIASLRRFLGLRSAAPAESLDETTQDRPPPLNEPPVVRAPDVETAPVEVSLAETITLETTAVETVVETAAIETTFVETTDLEAAVRPSPVIPDLAEQVAEIRALLEAMAEPPAEAEIDTEAAEIPADTSPTEIEPPAVQAPAPPTVGAPGGSLVLTLAAPPSTFSVAKAGATLGRAEDNSIRLDDLSVSRHHARIAYRQGGYWLSDLGSMGGTWIAGARLDAAQRIEAGDVIDIGHCRLTASFAAEPTASSPRKTGPSTPKRRPSRAR